MYRDSEMGFVAFNGWMDSLGIKSPVVNINDSFFDPLSRPFMSLHLPTEMLSDLMSGQIIIVMCFDNELFFTVLTKRTRVYISLAMQQEQSSH